MGIFGRIQTELKYDVYMYRIIDPPLHGTGQQPLKAVTLTCWTVPFSFATTKGIPFGFFSSPN